MKYLIDTNIFIEAKNGFFAFDICPGFWNWLKSNREIRSINMVREELLQGNDDLSSWIREELPEDFFLTEDTTIQEKYSELVNYVYSLSNFQETQKKYLSRRSRRLADCCSILHKFHYHHPRAL